MCIHSKSQCQSHFRNSAPNYGHVILLAHLPNLLKLLGRGSVCHFLQNSNTKHKNSSLEHKISSKILF